MHLHLSVRLHHYKRKNYLCVHCYYTVQFKLTCFSFQRVLQIRSV